MVTKKERQTPGMSVKKCAQNWRSVKGSPGTRRTIMIIQKGVRYSQLTVGRLQDTGGRKQLSQEGRNVQREMLVSSF